MSLRYILAHAALLGTLATPALAQRPARPVVEMPPATGALPAAWTAAPLIPLWPEGPPGGGFSRVAVPTGTPATFLRNIDRPAMRLFRPAHPNGATILVTPGGAYQFLSIRNEGVDVAARLNALGYTVYVLLYRLPDEGWRDRADVPLQDAQRAMRMVRAAATTDGLDPHRIAVLGFSAGGHLAATLETDFAQTVYPPRDAIDRIDARPDAAGLIYPVIAVTAPETHALSAANLLGKTPDAATIARRSPATHVSATTPPTFLVHALDDDAVTPDNSLIMLAALRRAHRPVEAHFVEEGGHGFGTGPDALPAGHWIEGFDRWLKRTFATVRGGSAG